MTTPKFTPGPLEVSHKRNKFDSTFDSLTIIAPDGIVLATINVPAFAPLDLSEPIANAHLYSSAPDLYAALGAMIKAAEKMQHSDDYFVLMDEVEQARAALAKASGMKGGE